MQLAHSRINGHAMCIYENNGNTKLILSCSCGEKQEFGMLAYHKHREALHAAEAAGAAHAGVDKAPWVC